MDHCLSPGGTSQGLSPLRILDRTTGPCGGRVLKAPGFADSAPLPGPARSRALPCRPGDMRQVLPLGPASLPAGCAVSGRFLQLSGLFPLELRAMRVYSSCVCSVLRETHSLGGRRYRLINALITAWRGGPELNMAAHWLIAATEGPLHRSKAVSQQGPTGPSTGHLFPHEHLQNHMVPAGLPAPSLCLLHRHFLLLSPTPAPSPTAGCLHVT